MKGVGIAEAKDTNLCQSFIVNIYIFSESYFNYSYKREKSYVY